MELRIIAYSIYKKKHQKKSYILLVSQVLSVTLSSLEFEVADLMKWNILISILIKNLCTNSENAKIYGVKRSRKHTFQRK